MASFNPAAVDPAAGRLALQRPAVPAGHEPLPGAGPCRRKRRAESFARAHEVPPRRPAPRRRVGRPRRRQDGRPRRPGSLLRPRTPQRRPWPRRQPALLAERPTSRELSTRRRPSSAPPSFGSERRARASSNAPPTPTPGSGILARRTSWSATRCSRWRTSGAGARTSSGSTNRTRLPLPIAWPSRRRATHRCGPSTASRASAPAATWSSGSENRSSIYHVAPDRHRQPLRPRLAGEPLVHLVPSRSANTGLSNSDGGISTALTYTDSTQPELDRSRGNNDRRHVFTASFVIALPTFDDKGAFQKNVLGDWEVTSIVQASTGYPITVFVDTPDGIDGNAGLAGTGYAGNQRPNRDRRALPRRAAAPRRSGSTRRRGRSTATTSERTATRAATSATDRASSSGMRRSTRTSS